MNTTFASATLTTSDFTGSTLTAVDFGGATLTATTFTNTNLLYANLAGSILTTTIWGNTICPDGTNSDSHSVSCLLSLAIATLAATATAFIIPITQSPTIFVPTTLTGAIETAHAIATATALADQTARALATAATATTSSGVNPPTATLIPYATATTRAIATAVATAIIIATIQPTAGSIPAPHTAVIFVTEEPEVSNATEAADAIIAPVASTTPRALKIPVVIITAKAIIQGEGGKLVQTLDTLISTHTAFGATTLASAGTIGQASTVIPSSLPPVIRLAFDSTGEVRLLFDRLMMCLLVICMVLIAGLYIAKKRA
jgi:hypothetical protein